MHKQQSNKEASKSDRVRMTVQLSAEAYQAISEIQRKYRVRTKRAKPTWQIIDAAVKAYAKQRGIKIHEQYGRGDH